MLDRKPDKHKNRTKEEETVDLSLLSSIELMDVIHPLLSSWYVLDEQANKSFENLRQYKTVTEISKACYDAISKLNKTKGEYDYNYYWMYSKEKLADDVDSIICRLLAMIEIKSMIQQQRCQESEIYTASPTASIDLPRAITGEPKFFTKTVEKNNSRISNITIIKSTSPFVKVPVYLEVALKGLGLPTINLSEYKESCTELDFKQTLVSQHKDLNDYFFINEAILNKVIQKVNRIMFRQDAAEIVINNRNKMSRILPLDIFSNQKITRVSVQNHDLHHLDYADEYTEKLYDILQKIENPTSLQIEISQSVAEILLPTNLAKTKAFELYFSHLEHNTLPLYVFKNLELLTLQGLRTKILDISLLYRLSELRLESLQFDRLVISEAQHNTLINCSKLCYISENMFKQLYYLQTKGFNVRFPESYDDDYIRRRLEKIKSVSAAQDTDSTTILPAIIKQPKEEKVQKTTSKMLFSEPTSHTYNEMVRTASIKSKSGIFEPSEYRNNILTHLNITPTEIEFKPHESQEEARNTIQLDTENTRDKTYFTEKNLTAVSKEHPNVYMGNHGITKEWTPLPSLSANDRLLLIDNEAQDQISIQYCKETQQYFAKSDSGDHTLYYMMEPKRNTVTSPEVPALPDAIQESLHQFFEHIKHDTNIPRVYELNNIRNEPDLRNRILLLEQYFKAFTEKQSSTYVESYLQSRIGITHPGMLSMLSSLVCQAGVCRHRAMLFMMLAHYFKIPARVITNDTHAFVEYFSDRNWKKLDLGGGKINKVHTIDPWENKATVAASSNKIIDKKPENIVETYSSMFNVKKVILNPENWHEALCKIKNPLLQYKTDEDAWLFHQTFLQNPDYALGKNYFYIHEPSDFDHLLKQWQVKDNGMFYTQDGPLAKMLREDKGTLLINWSRFSESEVAQLKSLLDQHPTLNGKPVSNNIRIINMVDNNLSACSAFYSRLKRVEWPLPSNSTVKKPCIETKNVDHTIDLYQSRDWETLLFGKLEAHGERFQYRDGALLGAIKKGTKTIALTGIPNDPFFQTTMQRLILENGFYANGQWHHLPKDFSFSYVHTSNEASPNLPICEMNEAKKLVYYVNKQTYRSFLETYYIDEKGQAHTNPGLLKSLPKDATIVITDKLSDGEIRRLVDAADKRNITILSPVANNKNAELITTLWTKPRTDSSIIISNDIDQAARLIHDDKAMVREISAQTDYADLFEKLALHSPSEQRDYRTLGFQRKSLACLEHLLKGGTVTLKGTISPELYHQIESLFSQNPYLVINGKVTPVTGRIQLVLKKDNHPIQLFAAACKTYTHEFNWDLATDHIEKYLKLTHQDASEKIKRVKAFYTKALELNLNPPLLLTEERVLQMVRCMQIYPEKRNPVKAFLHINYISDKETYDKLDELAKTHLGSTKAKSSSSLVPREKKLYQKVSELLQISPFVELRGTPGTGKTFFIEKFLHAQSGKAFWGEAALIDWLLSKQKPSYLLLDEANMSPSGHWDFLKGLSSGGIWYQNTFYPVSPETHKVIMTGNPEHYPGRHIHDFILHVPKVHFKSHTDQFLHDEIIFPVLKNEEATRLLIQAYHQLKTKLPYEPIGLRDLRAVLDHYKAMPNRPENEKLYLSCLQVFSGLFKTKQEKIAFETALQTQCSTTGKTLEALPQPDAKNNYYCLPKSRQGLWQHVHQALNLRNYCIAEKKPSTRAGILVEGPSGIGKTELMLQALQQKGFKPYKEGSTCANQYIHLTMGSTDISTLLLKAFHAGAVVVMDELNLLTEKDERLLTCLLEGKTPDNISAKVPGFTVLASQNPQSYNGRKLLSCALLNRLDCYYETEYTKEDLIELALASKKFNTSEDATRFVERFQNQMAAYPLDINMRNFFENLKAMTNPTGSFVFFKNNQLTADAAPIASDMNKNYCVIF